MKNKNFEKNFPIEPYRFSNSEAEQIKKIVLSGKLHHNLGRYIQEFEKEFSRYIGAKYSFSTNSGASALQLALHSLGIGPGDEVIVPAYTFIAVAQPVIAQGAVPVFADIDETFNISPEDVKKKITSRTKAVIVVHMFGNVAKINEIMNITRTSNLKVIEDAAQSIGAEYGGKKVGSIGDIGYFSFNIQKAIPTGQGGMAVTSNPAYAEKIFQARNRGFDKNKEVVSVGYTMFMTEMEAALGLSVLKKLDSLNSIRATNAGSLLKALGKFKDIMQPPLYIKSSKPSFYRMVFQLNEKKLSMKRDDFIKAMNAKGIPFRTFYPRPLYDYALFKKDKRAKCPNAEKFCNEQVGIEFGPYLTKKHIQKIADAVSEIIESRLKGSENN